MTEFLISALLISLGINILGFLVAYNLKTDKLTDFSYALSFVTVNIFGLFKSGNFNLPNILIVLAITLWAIRLASYLVVRIKAWGRDRRFDGVREDFKKFFKFWFFQGLTAWVVSIAALQFINLNDSNSSLSLVTVLGLLIFAKGLTIESIADLQLFKFSQNKENKGKFIDLGLWKRSRHPNYLGEITVWFGIWVATLPALSLNQAILGFISPLFIFLIIRFASGVPKLEKSAQEKWGSDKNYQAYKKRTGLILPFKLSKNI
jgi:steroid 5-alpha reductase family enzyme